MVEVKAAKNRDCHKRRSPKLLGFTDLHPPRLAVPVFFHTSRRPIRFRPSVFLSGRNGERISGSPHFSHFSLLHDYCHGLLGARALYNDPVEGRNEKWVPPGSAANSSPSSPSEQNTWPEANRPAGRCEKNRALSQAAPMRQPAPGLGARILACRVASRGDARAAPTAAISPPGPLVSPRHSTTYRARVETGGNSAS